MRDTSFGCLTPLLIIVVGGYAYVSDCNLDGGYHAQFGSYGPQDGYGIPNISGEEQIRQTAEAIAAFAVR